MKEIIVISAVNLTNGGPFSILKECIDSIDNSEIAEQYHVIVLVHKLSLFPRYNNLELIEFPKSKKNYLYRFYYEYYGFQKKFRREKIKLWLSLHDMTPKVKAEIQAVYIHNIIFLAGGPKELSLKGLAFSSLYKYVCKINIHANKYLVVQQDWLRAEFTRIFSFPSERIVVARPSRSTFCVNAVDLKQNDLYTFVYPSYPRAFKNFELICEAAKLLKQQGVDNFCVKLTISGFENDYSRFIVKKYSGIKNIQFIGLQDYSKMPTLYANSDCLLFPSKLESWGLPISEYMGYDKPMIIADLPYAHETAGGAKEAAFIGVEDAREMAERMKELVLGVKQSFHSVPIKEVLSPTTKSWVELINYLLQPSCL